MSKYVVCSGWKRGGTSALMIALRQAGIPILGFKYPIFMRTPQGKIEAGMMIPLKDEDKDNPTGFWELPSIAKDIGLQKQHKDLGMDGDLVKIPFDTLFLSDPDFVDKIIIVLREPRKVIASRLKRESPDNIEVWIKSTATKMLSNAENAMNWIKQNKKQYRIVSYENLFKDPIKELRRIGYFLGRGNYMLGAKVIDEKLDRVKPAKSNCEELKKVEDFYHNLLKQ